MTLWQVYRWWFSTPMAILVGILGVVAVLVDPSYAASLDVIADGDGIHLHWSNIINSVLAVLIALGAAMPIAIWKVRGMWDELQRHAEELYSAHSSEAEHTLYLRRRE